MVRLTSDVAVETLHNRFAYCETEAMVRTVLTLNVLTPAEWREQMFQLCLGHAFAVVKHLNFHNCFLRITSVLNRQNSNVNVAVLFANLHCVQKQVEENLLDSDHVDLHLGFVLGQHFIQDFYFERSLC